MALSKQTSNPAKNAGLRNNFDMKLLTELYKIPAKTGNEEQIKSFVLESVKDIPMQVVTDEIGNLFFIKGTAESYPCVAAHLDEVHLPCE